MSRRVLPGVLVLLDLGERLPVVSGCTGSSHRLAARLGDKCSDKPLLPAPAYARGVRPVLGDHRLRGQAAGGGAPAGHELGRRVQAAV
jgi:hypothetical protein